MLEMILPMTSLTIWLCVIEDSMIFAWMRVMDMLLWRIFSGGLYRVWLCLTLNCRPAHWNLGHMSRLHGLMCCASCIRLHEYRMGKNTDGRYRALSGLGWFWFVPCGGLGWSQKGHLHLRRITHRGTHTHTNVRCKTWRQRINEQCPTTQKLKVFYWSGGFWRLGFWLLFLRLLAWCHRFPCLLSSSAPVVYGFWFLCFLVFFCGFLGFRGLTFQWRLSHSKTVLVQSLTAKTAHTYITYNLHVYQVHILHFMHLEALSSILNLQHCRE